MKFDKEQYRDTKIEFIQDLIEQITGQKVSKETLQQYIKEEIAYNGRTMNTIMAEKIIAINHALKEVISSITLLSEDNIKLVNTVGELARTVVELRAKVWRLEEQTR